MVNGEGFAIEFFDKEDLAGMRCNDHFLSKKNGSVHFRGPRSDKYQNLDVVACPKGSYFKYRIYQYTIWTNNIDPDKNVGFEVVDKINLASYICSVAIFIVDEYIDESPLICRMTNRFIESHFYGRRHYPKRVSPSWAPTKPSFLFAINRASIQAGFSLVGQPRLAFAVV